MRWVWQRGVLRSHFTARLGHHLATARILQPLPQAQIAGELALVVIKLGMLLIGLLLRFQRPVTHVLHAQRRGNDEHFSQGSALARLHNHAAHTRVQRQTRQFLAHVQQVAALVHRAQFGQQLVAVSNRAARRSFKEREVHHIAQTQRLHAQDHARERRTQDFRVSKWGRLLKSASSYRRIQIPSATRPQRPARWLAAACEIGSTSSCSTLLRKE